MNNGPRSGVEGESSTPSGPPRKMRQEEKYEKILFEMSDKYRVPFDELLDYIVTYRHNKKVMQRFTSLKRCMSKLANQPDVMKIEEWGQLFEGGLWDIVVQLLRKEVMSVAKLDEVCADVGNMNDARNWKQDTPIIPVDGISGGAPKMVYLLHQICQPRERSQWRRPEDTSLRVSYIVTLLCALQQRNTCQAIPLQVGAFLKVNGLSRRALDIMNDLGITRSYKRTLKLQDAQIQRSRDEVGAMKDDLCINVTIDNFDLADGVMDERLGDHGSHTSSTTGLIARGVEMPESGLKQTMLNSSYRVGLEEVVQAGIGHPSLRKLWCFYIFCAIRETFGDAFERRYHKTANCLDEAMSGLYARPKDKQVKLHIRPGDYDSRYRATPLEPLMIDESTTQGMLAIRHEIWTKQSGKSEDDECFQSVLFLVHGDQKTVDRIRSCRRIRSADRHPYDSNRWLFPCLGLWHMKFNYLMLLHKAHWYGASQDDSTLHANAASLGRKKLENPTKSFRKLEELSIHTFQARIGAIFMRNLNMNQRPRTSNEATDAVVSRLSTMTLDGLENYVEQIYEEIHGNKDEKTPQELWNHLVYLRNVFPYLLVKDGIKYGDIGHLRIAIAMLAIYYQGSENARYAKELLHLFSVTYAHGAASEELQHAILAHSIVNHRGERDTHFEKDRQLEFLNKFVKEASKRDHSSSKPAPDLIRKSALMSPQGMLTNYRFAAQVGYRSGTRHAIKSASGDILYLAERLWQEHSVTLQPKRHSASAFVAKDFLNIGVRHLSANLQRFNARLERTELINAGVLPVNDDDDDLNDEGLTEQERRTDVYRARLDDSSASEMESVAGYGSDSDTSIISRQSFTDPV